MNKVFIHSKDSKKKTIVLFLISLLPCILYGVYKNGILLYEKGLLNIFGIFRPILFVIIPVIIRLLLNLMFKNEDNKIYDLFKWSFIGLFIPPQMSIVLYIIIVLIGEILAKLIFRKLDWPIIISIVIPIVLIIMNKYTYLNHLEVYGNYSFSVLDLLWGRSIGGICSTSTIFSAITLLFLLGVDTYKKEIPLISISVFTFLSIVRLLFINDFSIVFANFSGIILGMILIGTHLQHTPYLMKARVLYAIIMGLLSFGSCFIEPFLGPLVTLFIMTVSYKLFDKLITSLRST